MKHDVSTKLEMVDIEHNRLFTQMNGLYEVIEKYGVSRPMMEAIDPNGELIEKGFFASYEELPIEATKGEASEEVLGTILVILGVILAASISYFRADVDYFSDNAEKFSSRIEKISSHFLNILGAQKDKLVASDIFDKSICDGYVESKHNFDMLIKTIPYFIVVCSKRDIANIISEIDNKLINGDIDNIDINDINQRLFNIFKIIPKAILDLLELSIKLSNGKLEITYYGAIREHDYDSNMHDLGWKLNDTKVAINKCQSVIISKSDRLADELVNMAKITDKLVITLKTISKNKVASDKKVKYKETLVLLKEILNISKKMFNQTTNRIFSCLETAISIGEVSIGNNIYDEEE